MSSTPPLPREIEADPDYDAIQARLAAESRRLWTGGPTTVSVLPLRPALASALGAAYREGHLVLGLERADEALGAEARGLTLVARAPRARVSRLLLVSDDGAERLYRHVERLGMTHTPRVLVAMLAADAAKVGLATTGREAAVKVVLVQHKHAVAALLRALVLRR